MGARPNVVHLDVFVEALCPYSTEFMKQQLLPTWLHLGNAAKANGRLNVTIVPFGKAFCLEMDGDFICECQHGPEECALNGLMNCVISILPDVDDHLPLLACIQGSANLETAFSQCLQHNSKSNWLFKCATSKLGRALHARAGLKTASAFGQQLEEVPRILVDGKLPGFDTFFALEQALCQRMEEPKPEKCADFE